MLDSTHHNEEHALAAHSTIESEISHTLLLIKKCIDCLQNVSSSPNFDDEALLQDIRETETRSKLFFQRHNGNEWPAATTANNNDLSSRFLLPLLISLGRLYEVLDSLPQELLPQHNKKPPAPPRGLLSLRNYTDICAFTELLVCATIVPAVPANVLLPIHERVRYQIPQSVAGRLDRQSLVWACEEQQHVDLELVIVALGRFLLLDRFRPMLLPRHLLDLYAAILFVQHDKNTKRTADSSPLQVIARRLGCCQTKKITEQQQEQQEEPVAVDAATQAVTYQQLLRYGRRAPLWLRHAVAPLLQDVAQRNVGAVVRVFVAAAREPSSAAQRLARVLTVKMATEMLTQLTDTETRRPMEQQQQTQAMVYTIWAILERHGVAQLIRTLLMPSNESKLLPTLKILWTIPPPPTNSNIGIQCLFYRPVVEGCSVMDLLVRIVSQRSVVQADIKANIISFWNLVLNQSSSADDDHKLFAIGLLQTMAPCAWDEQFQLSVKGDTFAVQPVIGQQNGTMATTNCGVEQVEQRASCICQHILPNRKSLTTELFRALLTCFFARNNSSTTPDVAVGVGRVVPMVALPILCETQSMETLMMMQEDGDEDGGLFSIMKIVFVQSSLRFKDTTAVASAKLDVDDRPLLLSFTAFAKCVGSGSSRKGSQFDFTATDDEDNELLLSVTCVLLSILVSVLELGSPSRSEKDESELRQLLDPLQCLSSEETNDEVAEMATHAVALIRSRSVGSSQGSNTTMMTKLEQAKSDLQSPEPPLRARGVVTLRNLANAVSGEETLVDVQELLDLAVHALGDEESYVYLAAVHTVAAIAGADPTTVLPMLSACFLSGTIPTPTMDTVTTLSLQQRAKLTEGLAVVVRRRVSLGNELPRLLQLLCFGRSDQPMITPIDDEGQQEKQIQAATHEYFVNDKDDEQKYDEKQYWEETQLRVRTGGPLFAQEETDLVRSGRILIATELVGVLSASVLTPYVATLIDCSIDALRLDSSRPVRRAGASLAREIYDVILRDDDDDSLEYATSVRAGRHDVLVAVLHRCKSADDLDDLQRHRFYDTATAARCEEALQVVETADTQLLAGGLALENKNELLRNPISRLLVSSREGEAPPIALLKEL